MVAHTQLHHRMHWALPYFIWQVWMSPTLVCSMLRFVCVVHTSEHCRRCSWSFVLRTVTATTSTCCPAPEHSVSLFQQWGHAWAMLTHGDGKNSHWDSGRKSCPIVRPTCHYLTYTRPTVFHIHLVILVGEQCYVARWYSELLMFLLPGMRLMPSHTYLANQLTVK